MRQRINVGIRTVVRDQLNATLASLIPICNEHQLIIDIVVNGDCDLSESHRAIIRVLRKRAGVYVWRERQRGAGIALYSLFEILLGRLNTMNYVWLMDDDTIVSKEFLNLALAKDVDILAAVQWVEHHMFDETNEYIGKEYINYPIAEPYCSIINADALATIPLSMFRPLKDYGGWVDWLYMSRMFMLMGLDIVCLGDAGIFHLYVPDDWRTWAESDDLRTVADRIAIMWDEIDDIITLKEFCDRENAKYDKSK